ncbi:tautomerase family protein [Pseudonocardia sp.]|jgi:phenylpyruvate tautomerase PptA (4-oxalocrotonate tautomerase family)|uniref:tautomerase family protein n=1 Tax=Pseudonocardia sp. TaxID=60912 RepID=UPI00260C38E8|nr:tautomerase family protein [Pseudonocardia sp.]MCW2721522.1 4-oxalocrotonate tautomerase [Pseudonocardia sp.]MDT7617376.1 4-oxalocrotonate tautomerase [Pseudonocardiales bacterium]
MSIISCDLRQGRTDEQKHALAAGLIQAVRTATGEPVGEVFLVIREGRGIDFVEAGEHLPEFVEGNVNDTELINSLHHPQ